MRMVWEHFQSHGFRRFAFYLHQHRPGPLAKMNALRRMVERESGDFYLIDLPTAQKKGEAYARGAPYRWLAKTIQKLPFPLAITAETDDPAIQIVHACLEAGIRIPEQVAVLGVNDDLLRCPLASIPLSSVDDNMEGIGYRAAAILDGLMSGRRDIAPLTLVAPRGLTSRQSTDALAVENEPVAFALQLIRKHFREDITAEDLAVKVPLSQRQLHTDFSRIVGRSLAEELAFQRIVYAARLLAETDMKVPTIARHCGLHDANRLCRTFKKMMRCTPSEFRHRMAVS